MIVGEGVDLEGHVDILVKMAGKEASIAAFQRNKPAAMSLLCYVHIFLCVP